jgi:pyruvate formate lyase activating enzyme
MWNRSGKEATCNLCKKSSKEISSALKVCLKCIRENPEEAIKLTSQAHKKIREMFNLPAHPPKTPKGIKCEVCANECRIGLNEIGYCGLRKNVEGKLIVRQGVLHSYYDPIPTNCCASWFCGASSGYNLAVFPYACSFNCIFCQNSEHKSFERVSEVDIDSLVLDAERASCICYFGGTPEPQLPFLIKATERILENKKLRICWEWNGTGNAKLVRRAAQLSQDTNGIIKFDLKAFDPNLNIALTGRSNTRTLENFRMISKEFRGILTATTLLVPGYIDKEEVEKIARFISLLDPNIPYSLLAFHPDFEMMDMPVTTRKLAEECYEAASNYLNRVNIGNKHLLWS